MYLSDAFVYKDDGLFLDGINYTGKFIHFLEALVKKRNLFADLIINNHIIPLGLATFSVNSGYVICCVNGRFALTEDVDVNEVKVSIHPANGDTLMESTTADVNTKLCARDTDVDIYFKVGSIYPFNELKVVVPESRFNALTTHNIPAKALDDYESVIVPSDTFTVTINSNITNPLLSYKINDGDFVSIHDETFPVVIESIELGSSITLHYSGKDAPNVVIDGQSTKYNISTEDVTIEIDHDTTIAINEAAFIDPENP
jgi:hypothetical protein